ncbi:MAG: PAS domain-containing protein [Blastocatellia bacterium]|nr:PAS domain-containing protein [Blastocatellia bacterium]
MTLRFKLYCYIAVVHLALAVAAVPFLLTHTAWLFLVEALFVASLITGLRLVGSVFRGVERVRLGASFLADEDYSSRFLEIGQPELDQLIRIYNRMADGLRDERIRLHEQNFFLERLMDASPVGVLTFDFDGRVAAANPVAERMLGVATEQDRRKSLEDVVSGLAVEISPTQRWRIEGRSVSRSPPRPMSTIPVHRSRFLEVVRHYARTD